MAELTVVKEPIQMQMKDLGKSLNDKIKERQSKILVFGFCGPVGSGISSVEKEVASTLKTFNYEVEKIKLSDFIIKHIKKTSIQCTEEELTLDTAKRIMLLQDAGNELRHKYVHDILSQFAITEIGARRVQRIDREKPESKGQLQTETPHRVAFLINSIKHPAEINLLRTVYGNLFYLFGILCAEPIRLRRLREKGFKEGESHDVIERDKNQPEKYGQQLDKALQFADFFIRNNHQNAKSLQDQIVRFLNLIFSIKRETPTCDEYAMYVAQSAALRSACISRQVGAAILNKNNDIISTGCNDVPKYGGGLYTPANEDDDRCAYRQEGKCTNEDYKNKFKTNIGIKIRSAIGNTEQADALAKEIFEDTWVKDILEYSRAVHAEMDAIVAAARNGSSVNEGTLYTSTFPCHNCARHIIASGIRRVIYIEPYEKSQALELHGDSIELDTVNWKESPKVSFLHFEGVAPRQYLNLFRYAGDKKKDGKLIEVDPEKALPVVPEYLDTFIDFESQIVKHLESLGFIASE